MDDRQTRSLGTICIIPQTSWLRLILKNRIQTRRFLDNFFSFGIAIWLMTTLASSGEIDMRQSHVISYVCIAGYVKTSRLFWWRQIWRHTLSAVNPNIKTPNFTDHSCMLWRWCLSIFNVSVLSIFYISSKRPFVAYLPIQRALL